MCVRVHDIYMYVCICVYENPQSQKTKNVAIRYTINQESKYLYAKKKKPQRKELFHLNLIPHGHLYTVTYTRGRIDTIDSRDDEHLVARNM